MAEMVVRAELYCYFCGHGFGEVLIPARQSRPSVVQLRAAYGAMAPEAQPEWDATGQPICPRCTGQLFLERHEFEIARRPVAAVAKKELKQAS